MWAQHPTWADKSSLGSIEMGFYFGPKIRPSNPNPGPRPVPLFPWLETLNRQIKLAVTNRRRRAEQQREEEEEAAERANRSVDRPNEPCFPGCSWGSRTRRRHWSSWGRTWPCSASGSRWSGSRRTSSTTSPTRRRSSSSSSRCDPSPAHRNLGNRCVAVDHLFFPIAFPCGIRLFMIRFCLAPVFAGFPVHGL